MSRARFRNSCSTMKGLSDSTGPVRIDELAADCYARRSTCNVAHADRNTIERMRRQVVARSSKRRTLRHLSWCGVAPWIELLRQCGSRLRDGSRQICYVRLSGHVLDGVKHGHADP